MKSDLNDIFAALRQAGAATGPKRGHAWKVRTIPRNRPIFVVNRASGRVLGFGLGIRAVRAWLKKHHAPDGLYEIVRDFEEFRELFFLTEAVLVLRRMGVERDFLGLDNVVHAWAWERMHETARPLDEFIWEVPQGTPWVAAREMVEYNPRMDRMGDG